MCNPKFEYFLIRETVLPIPKLFFLCDFIVVYLGLDELHLMLINSEPLMDAEISDR